MAGTLTIATLSDGTNSTSATNCIQGSAKAWVNFNGTGTVAIRASYNVSSVTDNGTGNYTINFTNALADANYSVVLGGSFDNSTDSSSSSTIMSSNNPTTSSIRIRTAGTASNLLDFLNVNASVFD
jgi:hypothetical protein